MVERLADGTAVVIRPIAPADKRLLQGALRVASPETVRRRFLSPKLRLSEAELRYLTEVDGSDHVALIAVLADQPNRFAGVARFVRLREDPATAEVAITVADNQHRKGLGTILTRMLADEARARGVQTFTATILGDNVAAQRLMRKLVERLERGPAAAGSQEFLARIAA
jgi:RimJ/RimL family protein N-acetyltransferase